MAKHTAQMFNVSHEKLRIQLNSVGFTFAPRSYAEVPEMDFSIGMENIPQYLEKEYGHRGIFWVNPEESFEEGERRALLRYLKSLELSEVNFAAWMDDYKKDGTTVPEPKRLRAIKQWNKEIYAKLDMIKPVDEIPSFFDADTRKKLGIDNPSAVTLPEVLKTSKKGNHKLEVSAGA